MLLSLACLLGASVAAADKIDDFVKAEMAKQKIPGLALGIIRKGVLVDSRAYGLSDLELEVKAAPDHLFEIGSITKQFTAVATLLLAEEGKLSLDDPVGKHIPEAPKSWQGITLRHMLYQTSGLPDYALVKGIGLLDEFDRKKYFEEITKLPLDFAPGVAWAYSNTNYAVMGWVIEKVSGKSYPEFMTERVLKPLGMSSTIFSDPYAIVPKRSHGYLSIQGQVLRTKPFSGSIQSDGTLMSNVGDMAKWDAALRERKLLKPQSYELMWSAAKLSNGRTRPYGTGWNLSAFGARPYVGHGGNSPGYSAGFARFTEADLSVVVLCNIYPVGGESMARQIAEILEPELRPSVPNGQPDPDTKRTSRVRDALLKLAEGKPDADLMEAEVTAPMSTGRARMFGPGALAALRKIDEMAYTGERKEGADTWVTYLVLTPQRDWVANVLVSDKGRLAQVVLRPAGGPKSAKART